MQDMGSEQCARELLTFPRVTWALELTRTRGDTHPRQEEVGGAEQLAGLHEEGSGQALV
jgi:hypothetical protein